MTKRSRRPAGRPDRSDREQGAERSSVGPSGSARAGRRSRPVRRYDDRSFFDRYRSLLVLGFALAGVALIAALVFGSAFRRAYACEALLTPGPVEELPTPTPVPSVTIPATPTASPSPTVSSSPGASPTAAPTPTASPSPTAAASPSAGASPTAVPTPVPSPTPLLGFVTRDLGRLHVPTGSVQSYEYCPPASGPHYIESGRAPLRRDLYGPTVEQPPGNWVHNLEHGYVVALYSCGENGQQCPSEAEMAALRQFMDQVPRTTGAESCNIPNKVLAVRFDRMQTRFALAAWDRVLLMDEFDVQRAIEFANQWIDSPQSPEQGVC